MKQQPIGRETIIKNLLKILIDKYNPDKIILFGSHAQGTAGRDSDIDLLIVKQTSERGLDRWTQVQRLITQAHRAVPVETLVLTPEEVDKRIAVGDQFISEILNKGKLLYAA